ncbi:MAG: hypothetical protein EBR79_01885, partial [Proteobacteria bacterium]|nr:hypothetical protein [Pseudomonadota bacterium]
MPTKFTFDTEFFDVATGNSKPNSPATAGGVPGRLPTTAGNAMAGTSRQSIFDEGFANGLQEGRKQAQADLAQLQQHLQSTLLSLQTMLNEREAQILSQMLSLLHTTLHRMVGTLVEKWPQDLLEHHLKSVITSIKTDESLTLRLHPAARGYHEKLQLPHASVLGLPMHIAPDASLSHTDVVVEWKNGGAE